MPELDARTKELVAIGVSVVINCQPCLNHHIKKAQSLNVSNDEIIAVLKLAKGIDELVSGKVMEYAEKLLNMKPTESLKPNDAVVREDGVACC
ncbi:carboxymuconolactone decarboxylase family protein [candidate division KSB1 bacterium]|nr:carboxymuconolactone decarboxylase family protein [candidate division KSB1 bacterium]NIR69351.1 carboxymuconolactone decarboxylase family protein [candidate division KSB1 bacterium]NIS24169.1 carboxymuconolactone decarboxylase family protein [candidate division KSB1 bacterium]NIT71084.1 carboxymuconolactone decarboxylase family protein [candidate division KSB1 bacterium]NIU24788.1 carboxymuconolactone decarboxylase family protein [candidate division KSB1 bacterium]